MKLRALIEAVLPSLVDDLDGYKEYELSLVATRNGETVAQTLVCIRCTNVDDYTITSTEVQVLERV